MRPGSELELESTFAKYSVTKRALTMTFSLLKVPTKVFTIIKTQF